MFRRFFCSLVALLALLPTAAGNGKDEGREAFMEIHRKAIVFDAHCDTAMRLVGESPIDLGERQKDGHIDLPRAREGGLDAQIFAVWVPPQMPESAYSERAFEMIDALWEQARKHQSDMEIALDGRDVRRIVKRGKLAAVIGIEGAHVIGDDPSVLRSFYERGVRCLTLTWMNTNLIADSSDDSTRWHGLSEKGREVIHEMDSLGMLIDCAHASQETVFDVLGETSNPIIVSHSCMRALCDIPRNVSDEVLRAVAAKGGVVCVNFYVGFLAEDHNRRIMSLYSKYRARARELATAFDGSEERAWRAIHGAFEEEIAEIPPVPVSVLVDHIDHAVKVAGVEHVGLGSDFDGISLPPEGLEDVSCLPRITEELLERGYSAVDIEKILGGNLLRVVESVIR